MMWENVQEFPLSKKDSTGLEAMPFFPMISATFMNRSLSYIGDKGVPISYMERHLTTGKMASLIDETAQPALSSGSPNTTTAMCYKMDAILKACGCGFPFPGLSPLDL